MKSVLVAGIAGLAATTLLAQSSTTAEIVQYSAKVTMSNTGTSDTPNASGTVQATESTNNSSKKTTDKETLNIMAKGLDTNTDYTINATVSGTSSAIGTATTDARGNLKAMFSTSGNSKNNLGAPPTPLTSMSEVDVSGASGTVLVADMTAPGTLKYSVRKNVSDTTSGASAGLTVSSSTKRAAFGLSASGLTGGDSYVLMFNSKVVETNTASAKGTLKFINPLTTTNVVVTPFQLQSVELDDTNGTPAFSTSIP
jgi:hypothetical protein